MKREFRCHLCDEPIDIRMMSTYRMTYGWTKRRGQGGTNAIRLPEYGDKFAHESCVDMAAKGINSRQTSLLG